MIRQTAEQQAIIEAGATDLVVIAGAGSGKTHVLVERYLRLLASCRISEIAAVTFTEAAATEMRERVRRAVMTDPALSDDRRDMDEAAIGTVHALALRLLCEHPVEAAIDPAADVLADDEAELLRRIACRPIASTAPLPLRSRAAISCRSTSTSARSPQPLATHQRAACSS